jgi:hypothetical protein
VSFDDKTLQVHRLVAKAFVLNNSPKTKINVIHLDGNMLNNHSWNLKWATREQTVKHYMTLRENSAISKYKLNGKLVCSYDSVQDAAASTENSEMALSPNRILDACRSKRKRAGGWLWSFKTPDTHKMTVYKKTTVWPDDLLRRPEYAKLIPGASNYIATIDGKIYSFRNKAFMAQKLAKDGYYSLAIVLDSGKRNKYLVHRLVAMTFIPNPDNLPSVDHIDNDKTNNNMTNLRWSTPSDNTLSYYRHKRANSPPTGNVKKKDRRFNRSKTHHPNIVTIDTAPFPSKRYA